MKQLIVVTLAFSLTASGFAQSGPVSQYVTPANEELKIFVLQGEGAINSISARTATEPILEVRDVRNRPVEGATVAFELPNSGPGGFFAGQQLKWIGTTNAMGQIVAPGLVPNAQSGRFNIRVSASLGNSIGRAIVSQANSLRPRVEVTRRSGTPRWVKPVLIIGLAAGAGVGVWWATQRNKNNPLPTVVLQPGTISIGGPR